VKTRNKILAGAGMVVLLVICFYIIFPFYLVGPPLPFLSLKNRDDINHEVVIEIFDQNNKSIFKETYELDPEEEKSSNPPTPETHAKTRVPRRNPTTHKYHA